MENFITVLEIIGTIAFALSGALVALKKDMDLFGVVVLSLITAIGGGVIRDIVLGLTPPAAFMDPLFSIVALLTGAITFYIISIGLNNNYHIKHGDLLLQLTDALGLGIFTINGIIIAQPIPHATWFLCLFTGLITGVGGGILRDLLAQEIPFIFRKFFYASASLSGALIFLGLQKICSNNLAMTLGALTIIALRILAITYHWQLPKCHQPFTNNCDINQSIEKN